MTAVIQDPDPSVRESAVTALWKIGGPRAAEGFTWWKIRTSAGIEGWVVESVDDNGSRLQTLIPE